MDTPVAIKKFDGITGQFVPVKVLSHLIKNDRLPGTFLFSGPAGVGKLATALTLAKILHCETPGERACMCRSCHAIRTGAHPDVIVISRDRKLSVNEMREIVSFAKLKSSAHSRRIVIIDRAENATVESYNAALKMLEEPGERTHFILITDIPSMLLDTVRSRSYQVRFKLLSEDSLMRFAVLLGASPDDTDTSEAVRFSCGRPGLYLRWRFSESYRSLVGDMTNWLNGVMNMDREPSVESMLEWKNDWRGRDSKSGGPGFMSLLAEAETDLAVPRGGDVYEIAETMKQGSKFIIEPINWQVEGKGTKSAKAWSDSRKALLVAGFLRTILASQGRAEGTSAVLAIQDFMRKIKWNCSFDLALERLYFKLAGN